MEKEGTESESENYIKKEILREFGNLFEEINRDELEEPFFIEKNPTMKNILDRYFILPSGIVLLFSAFKENTWGISPEKEDRNDFNFLIELEDVALRLNKSKRPYTTILRENVKGYGGCGIRVFPYLDQRAMKIVTKELRRRHRNDTLLKEI